MISNHQNQALGVEVDNFLESRPFQNFDYVECTECHLFHEIQRVELSKWRFSLMGLRPGLLRCAKGLCPDCQEALKLFKPLLDRIGSIE